MKTYLVWSIEHDAWWRPGWCGYTRVLAEAGRYAEIEARAILDRANVVKVNECLIPIECVADVFALDQILQPSIVCPRCGSVSYHPKDISEHYCGRCHRFHDETTP